MPHAESQAVCAGGTMHRPNSELAEKNVKFSTRGTQLVQKSQFLCVPSDAENRVQRKHLRILIFCIYSNI